MTFLFQEGFLHNSEEPLPISRITERINELVDTS